MLCFTDSIGFQRFNMATACHLLGPPELLNPQPLSAEATTTNIIDTLTTQLKSLNSSVQGEGNEAPEANMDSTEKKSQAFPPSGNSFLDFFFYVVPDTLQEELIGRLELAWTENALMTLKLICNLRKVGGAGKWDKEGFYTVALWLHCFHPKTLAGNIKAFADFGYLKDFLEILCRILEGPLIRKISCSVSDEKNEVKGRKRTGERRVLMEIKEEEEPQQNNYEEENYDEEESGWKPEKKEREEKKVIGEEEIKLMKEKQRALRKEKELIKAKRALEKYNNDENYRFLHDTISDLFVQLLRADVENLNAGHLDKITLTSKWCPTVDSSYDKSTLMCESIARKMFPREKFSEYEGLEERHYVYRVRDRLRKEVLVPLYKALELPEVFMSDNRWNALPYEKVPLAALKNYRETFFKHDGRRFKEYLDQVESGKAKIEVNKLLPHEIIRVLGDVDKEEAAELQWKSMVDDLAKKRKFCDCIAVSSVSESMKRTPVEVSIALGILVSELSDEPWKGKLISFTVDAELEEVEGDNLKAKVDFVRGMNWAMNIDFQKLFDRILEVAIQEKLSEEKTIKRVLVFTEVDFDEASRKPWATDYQAIQKKFREKGYKNVPEVVFWNLSDQRATPVLVNQTGLQWVSGFRRNLLTMFLERSGVVDPAEVMELAIAAEEYEKLFVLD